MYRAVECDGGGVVSKYKDGELIGLYWEVSPEYEVVKGWCDIELCQKAVAGEYGEDRSPVVKVEHKYGFWGVGRDECGEPRQVFYDREESGRGRFKVTLAYTEVA